MSSANHPLPDTPAPDQHPPRDPFLPRLLLAGLIFLIALVALRLWWGHAARNHLDQRLDAYRAAGQPVQLADLATEPIPDEHNAAFYFNQAVAALTPPQSQVVDVTRLSAHPEACRVFATEVDPYLNQNTTALDLFHQACQHDQVNWQLKLVSPGINIIIPHTSSQRALAKLTRLAALRAHQRGNDLAALQHVQNLLTSARLSDPGGPFLIVHMVRAAIDGSAIGTIEAMLPTLSIASAQPPPPDTHPARPEQLHQLIADLLDEADYVASQHAAIVGERTVMLDTVLTFSTRPSAATSMNPVPRPLDAALAAALKPAWLLDSARMCDTYDQIADAVLCPTWPAARDRLPPYAHHPENRLAQLSRLFSSVLLPSYDRAIEIHFRGRANRRMAAAALALLLYRHDHGHLPATLDDLVPDYLPHVPADPFDAANAPLGYLPNADQPRLYSRNTDGLDQQGEYTLRDAGRLDGDSPDLPFFINGDRPRPDPLSYVLPEADWPPATQPANADPPSPR